MLKLNDPTLLRSRCLIDGAWVGADDGRTLEVSNPAHGETIASVPLAGAAETLRAISAAERAIAGWKAQTAEARARVLRRWFDLMLANQDDLALIMTSEQGKPLAEARGEIATAIGGALTASPVVRKLTFTGSTEIGRLLAAQCAPTLKRLSLELGGNAPFIVFDDADLDAAVAGAIASKFRNTGQTCVCTNRLLVQDEVYDRFAEKLGEAVARLEVGNGAQADVTQGPLIDAPALAKVEELVADAVAQGARCITGGQRHALGGTFYQPTILADVTPAMKLAREEIFGPVAPLFRFETEAEAIALANDTEFGLASYFFSRDLARVWRVAGALDVGMVGINTGVISTAVAPFGGVKQSGMGREGSRYGIEGYIDTKYLCMGGL